MMRVRITFGHPSGSAWEIREGDKLIAHGAGRTRTVNRSTNRWLHRLNNPKAPKRQSWAR